MQHADWSTQAVDDVWTLTKVEHSHSAVALEQALGDVARQVVVGDVKVQQFTLHRDRHKVSELHRSKSSLQSILEASYMCRQSMDEHAKAG